LYLIVRIGDIIRAMSAVGRIFGTSYDTCPTRWYRLRRIVRNTIWRDHCVRGESARRLCRDWGLRAFSAPRHRVIRR